MWASMNEKRYSMGPEDLNEFGQYLNGLQGFESYTFELEDPRGRMVDKKLEEVLAAYTAFLTSKQLRIRIRITCCDYKTDMIHQTDKVISRVPV